MESIPAKLLLLKHVGLSLVCKESEMKDEMDKLVKWIKRQVDEAGATGIVIGLSGGIDSSVVACLCVKALGANNVLGLMMPADPEAVELADNLGIETVSITTWDFLAKEITFPLDSGVAPYGKTVQLTRGNVESRLRMVHLYMYANHLNRLVVGTSNRSELFVNYFTKFGDGGVDFEPLGQFLKTEVYEMARLLPEIPSKCMTKKPSAGLWQGQTDEEELGMTYDELDKFIRTLDEGSYVESDNEMHRKIWKLHLSGKHKCRMPPSYLRSTR